MIGSRFAHFEITAHLGSGGMGEVYQATDTKLGRKVAVKILPEVFTHDTDRLARFEREARVLASLNHPNIAAIHGLEESGERKLLVMELVEGETLAERIARGPLPIDQAMPLARQITEALEAAHERGIIHRDLKPANIKITPDSKVKVLDFGLAKAFEGEAANPSLSKSPTISMAATNAGVILGTAGYMSPEQARGLSVDRRADIFSFGCVLYEMLTGRKAFQGDTVSDVLAAVLKLEPDWSRLPAETPSQIRKLLVRCLNKDPQKRLPHIGAARIEIDDWSATDALVPATPRKAAWVASGIGLILGAALVLLWWSPWKTQQPASPLRLSAELGAAARLMWDGVNLALSPDGMVFAFTAQEKPGDMPQLYVRTLDQLQATPLSGTNGATDPFFSPDGQWIGFFAGGKLKKIPVRGGAAVTLSDAPNGRGGSWTEDGTIVYSPNNLRDTVLMRVSSSGGKPEPVTKLQGEAIGHRWPQVLPGGKAVLFTVQIPSGGNSVTTNLEVQTLSGGAPKIVQQGASYGRYVPGGHLIYMNGGTLFAVPFDTDRLEVTGQAVPAVEGVSTNELINSGQFAVSNAGTLVFEPVRTDSLGQSMSWMDADGKISPLRPVPSNWANPRFSPDGRRVAMDIWDGKQRDIWIYDWGRDTLSRLTFDPVDDSEPVWTPDGHRIVFSSKRGDGLIYNIYWQLADGTGQAERLTESKNHQFPNAWLPNENILVFNEIITQGTNRDLMTLKIEGNETSGWKPGKPSVYLSTQFIETNCALSPDGAWLAYESNESGQFEVYVRPFIGSGGKWQISNGGGSYPVWSQKKHELFYGTPGFQIMVTSFTVAGHSFTPEKPRLWSPARFTTGQFQRYDLHPAGDRFAISTSPQDQSEAAPENVIFVFNFLDQLKRIASNAK